jgi:hypothetical protein
MRSACGNLVKNDTPKIFRVSCRFKINPHQVETAGYQVGMAVCESGENSFAPKVFDTGFVAGFTKVNNVRVATDGSNTAVFYGQGFRALILRVSRPDRTIDKTRFHDMFASCQ